MLVDFGKLQGFEDERVRELEILARAKDTDEAILEFRRLKEESASAVSSGNGKHIIAKGEPALL